MYITSSMIKDAISRMRKFEKDLNETFTNNGLSLRENTGRRNQFLSIAQEYHLAEALSVRYEGVKVDGSTGQPDIIIGEINKELECKLTSGRGKYRTYELQTDYETLRNKGRLDYLYMLTDRDFDAFCVIHFKGLTIEDFFPPANGSRGKSRMNKSAAMKKATVLFGSVENKNEKLISGLEKKYREINIQKRERIADINSRIDKLSDSAIKTYEKLVSLRAREAKRYDKKLIANKEKQELWRLSPPRYTFNLREAE